MAGGRAGGCRADGTHQWAVKSPLVMALPAGGAGATFQVGSRRGWAGNTCCAHADGPEQLLPQRRPQYPRRAFWAVGILLQPMTMCVAPRPLPVLP